MFRNIPANPLPIFVPLLRGSATDLSIRLMAKELEKILGQPVVVVNKPGAAFDHRDRGRCDRQTGRIHHRLYRGAPALFYAPAAEGSL